MNVEIVTVPMNNSSRPRRSTCWPQTRLRTRWKMFFEAARYLAKSSPLTIARSAGGVNEVVKRNRRLVRRPYLDMS